MLGVGTADAGPVGFWNGTDSTKVAIVGSAAPYSMPDGIGTYGGYIGMIGDWAKSVGCKAYTLAWSSANASQANANFARSDGVGTGAYWFMGGPGVDPKYNGTTAEASAWGAQQAADAIAAIKASGVVKYPVVFMDVEMPGSTVFDPALDNGWNDVYTSACSGRVKATYIAASVDRAEFNGFADYLTAHSSYKAGVYSSPAVWSDIFGTGTASSTLTNTYEWTYAADTSNLAHRPSAWCLSGTSTCAQFFGGMTSASAYALMWQWTGGGGTYNGYGDFDQIDVKRMK